MCHSLDLPEALIGCIFLIVYSGRTASSIIKRIKWTPEICCCCFQLLINIQQVKVSSPHGETKWNALDSFRMFCSLVFDFPIYLLCIILACEDVNTVYKIPTAVWKGIYVKGKESILMLNVENESFAVG